MAVYYGDNVNVNSTGYKPRTKRKWIKFKVVKIKKGCKVEDLSS